MKKFLKGMLLFSMVIVGVAGVITVDMRSGKMAGIAPTLEVYMKEVDFEEETEGYARAFELQMIVNNEAIVDKIEELEKNDFILNLQHL